MVILKKYVSEHSDTRYEVRRGGDGKLYCTCMGWRIPKWKTIRGKLTAMRNCLHLQDYKERVKK